jgi:hypothetical protein
MAILPRAGSLLALFAVALVRLRSLLNAGMATVHRADPAMRDFATRLGGMAIVQVESGAWLQNDRHG